MTPKKSADTPPGDLHDAGDEDVHPPALLPLLRPEPSGASPPPEGGGEGAAKLRATMAAGWEDGVHGTSTRGVEMTLRGFGNRCNSWYPPFRKHSFRDIRQS